MTCQKFQRCGRKPIVTRMASVAELEAGLTSQRTKAALQAAKKKGTVLGCRNDNVRFYAAQGAKAVRPCDPPRQPNAGPIYSR